jgi:hypothetical protein
VKPILGFKGNQVSYVHLIFDQARFPMMERIFIERYGPPTSRDTQEVQTRMGVHYTNEFRYWTGQTMTITLRRYGTKITEGWATYSPTSILQDLENQTEDAVKKGAGDLQ